MKISTPLLNTLLTMVLAFLTGVQAYVLWQERRTPLENALYDKQISATIQAAEAVLEKCRLRFTPPTDEKKSEQDWVEMMAKRRQAQFALRLIGNRELLALLTDVYTLEDEFDGEKIWKEENVAVKKSFGKAFGKQVVIFWSCSEIADRFLEKARKIHRLDALSEKMLEKLSKLGESDIPSGAAENKGNQ